MSYRTTEKQILKARSVSSYVSETNLEVKLKMKNFKKIDFFWEAFKMRNVPVLHPYMRDFTFKGL